MYLYYFQNLTLNKVRKSQNRARSIFDISYLICVQNLKRISYPWPMQPMNPVMLFFVEFTYSPFKSKQINKHRFAVLNESIWPPPYTNTFVD